MLARIGVKVKPLGATQGAIFCQGAEARRLPDLVLPVGLDTVLIGFAQRAVRYPWLPALTPRTQTRGEANLGGYCNKALESHLTDHTGIINID